MWQHLVQPPPPSRHAIRNTCMQLLPLVEMFCKWELEEDCSDLVSLMHRFDSQHQLESHEPGRSLLAMLGDEDGGFEHVPWDIPIAAVPSPFDSVRERLAAAALAIRNMQVQACTLPPSFTVCEISGVFLMAFNKSFIILSTLLVHCSSKLQSCATDCAHFQTSRHIHI